MTHKIDFDNADLAMIGIVLIMITMAIVAGVCKSVSFTQVLPFMEKLLYVLATLVTPGGLNKLLARIQDRKAQATTP